MKNPAARPQGIKDFYKEQSCSSPCGKPQGIIKLKMRFLANKCHFRGLCVKYILANSFLNGLSLLGLTKTDRPLTVS